MEIGVWGDSISYGAGDSEALGWVGRLRRSLFDKESVSLYNLGVCGDTTVDILKRFDIEADSIKPDLVIFAVGINDSKFPLGGPVSKVDLEDYKENISLLTQKARGLTEKICFIGATKVDESTDWGGGSHFKNATIETYNDFLKAHCKEQDLAFVDVFDVLSPDDLFDGLHPNSGGYEKMFQVISKNLNLA